MSRNRDLSNYHFIGIGGVGMSALAEAALQSGHEVTGSDRLLDDGQETQVLIALRAQGGVLFPQDGSGVTDDTECVVVSTAIEEDNPDLQIATQRGLEVLHRSEVLARLLNGKGRRVAVTGTCGKSTVTGMTGWLLTQAGRDPFVINGAPLADWMSKERVGSSRAGGGDVCVFEADESDKSLLNCCCEVVVITNSSADHFSKEEADELFDSFSERADEVIDARDQSFFDDVVLSADGFEYKSVFFKVPMPGQHNLMNAAIAVKVCERLGCELQPLADNLASFTGISRRLEFVGQSRGVCVYDDYAHNTEKIRAVWKALSDSHDKVVGIWRPHGYGPLKSMMDDLAAMFAEVLRPQDELVLLPVYDAGGTADRSINSDELARRIVGAGRRATYLATAEEACSFACESSKDGSTVVTLGARDPGLPLLAADIYSAL